MRSIVACFLSIAEPMELVYAELDYCCLRTASTLASPKSDGFRFLRLQEDDAATVLSSGRSEKCLRPLTSSCVDYPSCIHGSHALRHCLVLRSGTASSSVRVALPWPIWVVAGGIYYFFKMVCPWDRDISAESAGQLQNIAANAWSRLRYRTFTASSWKRSAPGESSYRCSI